MADIDTSTMATTTTVLSEAVRAQCSRSAKLNVEHLFSDHSVIAKARNDKTGKIIGHCFLPTYVRVANDVFISPSSVWRE